MRNQNIDQGWKFTRGMFGLMNRAEGKIVNLPHDYMLEGEVTEQAPAGPAMGYFTDGVAHYTKKIEIPAEWEGEKIGLRFDGVMLNATVEVNGSRVMIQHYGYAPFFADITNYVYCGEENRVTITVNPSMQPNSRWYSGAGIFRSLELVHTPCLHLANDGIFAYTKEIVYKEDGQPDYACVKAEIRVVNDTMKNQLARVNVSIKDDASGDVVVTRSALVQVNPNTEATAYLALTVREPKLWDAENPNLYKVCASVIDAGTYKTHMIPAENPTEDCYEVLFGIRTITADAVRGLQINGKTVKLKGGCLHHDNGILGAVSLYDSEVRKLLKMKEVGFNAVRTTHNPPSAVFMEACDRLGVYVFDEAFDAWGMAKQPGDYSMFFDTDWEKDLTAFVRRDRNHPSVIIWSTGNEIVERGGLNNGYTLATKLAECVKALDQSRPISNGVCSFWNGLDDHLSEAAMKKFAEMMSGGGNASAQNADTGAKDLTWENYTEAFTNGMDIVGYNYMENRYPQDHEMFPDRIILGSENYPKEIGFRWPEVEKHPYIIGDFTWTAYDYIGEAGIGKSVFVEKDDPMIAMGPFALMSHGSAFPWRLANDADLDINGNLLPQGAYRSVVWGSEKTFVYSYDPSVYGKTELISMWGFTDVRTNWNWKGQEGKPVTLMVFSAGDEVELLVNGASVGRKSVTTEGLLPKSVTFDAVFTPGMVEAISYRNGEEISRGYLYTTGAPAALKLTADGKQLAADGHGLSYVEVELTDAEGRIVPDADEKLTAEVICENGVASLAGFGSGNPITAENYTAGAFTTYRGRVAAVVRAGFATGKAVLRVTSETLGTAEMEFEIK